MARGGLLGLGIGAAAAVLAIVAGGIVAVRSFTGDSASGAPRAVTAGATEDEDGLRAPGTDALRKLGCDRATAVDMAQRLGGAGQVREGEPRTMVSCDVTHGGGPLTCDRIANAYFGALGGAAEGNVSVRVSQPGVPPCSRLYAPSGADLGVFPRPSP